VHCGGQTRRKRRREERREREERRRKGEGREGKRGELRDKTVRTTSVPYLLALDWREEK
jgi:hypothetical protein